MKPSISVQITAVDRMLKSPPRFIGITTLSLALSGMLIDTPALANSQDKLVVCRDIQNSEDRLRCYDKLVNTPPSPLAASPSLKISTTITTTEIANKTEKQASRLSQHWETNSESKHGTWNFRPHKPNYLLIGRYTDKVNYQPYETYFRTVNDPNIGLDNTESKFQLSFKLKAAENLFGSDIDLWFGYTQQNHWQVYNKNISAPFRETNYEPEAFITIPTNYQFLGLRGQFINVGFVHQSNGQSNILSRSWNRVYAQAGFEYGDNFGLTLKPWYRLPEKSVDDDNPNITDYMGNFEAVASYRLNNHTLSLLTRSTFGLKRGFAQLDWSFPLQDKLKGYVQFTSGYGESLIDYNHQQNTVGIGVLLSDWM